MIRLGIVTDEISQDFEEAVKFALENDLRNLEIRHVWGKNVGNLEREEANKIKLIADNYGARVAVVASPFLKCNLNNPKEYRTHLKILDNCIRQAHTYEANIIRIFTFWRVESIERHWDSIIEKLRGVVRKAEREGVTLAVETEGSTNVGTCDELRKLFDSLPSDNLKAVWDISNSYLGEAVGYPDGYRLIRGEVVHVHLKDFVKDPFTGTRKHTYIGEGLIPYEELFRDLLKDGFDGVASIEAGARHFKEKGTLAIPRHVKNLKSILTKVQGRVT